MEKQPRSRDSGRRVPGGSMETRDAGGLAPSRQENELRKREARKPLQPPAQAEAPGDALPAAAQPRRRGQAAAAGSARGKGGRRSPAPAPSHSLTARTPPKLQEETPPHGQGEHPVFQAEALYLPGWGFWGCCLRGAAPDWRDEDCRCGNSGFTNPGSGK